MKPTLETSNLTELFKRDSFSPISFLHVLTIFKNIFGYYLHLNPHIHQIHIGEYLGNNFVFRTAQ